MLHAITPPAKRGKNEEVEIDSGFNKPWAQLGIPRQPIFLKSHFSFFSQTKLHFSNYVEVLIVGCDLLPQIVEKLD